MLLPPPSSSPVVFGNPNDPNDFTQGYDCDKGGGELYVSVPAGWTLQCVRDRVSTNCSDGNSVDPDNLGLPNGGSKVVKAYYKPPPPAAPTLSNSSNSCSGASATLNFSSTGATYYQLRVDKAPNSWNGDCTSPNAGDICDNNAPSPYTFTSEAGTAYRWWVHACNNPAGFADNCSTEAESTFTCAAAPTGLSASCPAPGTTATLSWTDGSGATAHNLRVNKITGATPEWNGNCTAPQPGDFCRDNTSSPQTFTSTASSRYGWWVDACTAAGCNTTNGADFTCTPPTLIATCSVNPTSTITGQNVTWTATVGGGTSPYTYSWSGTDGLSGTTASVTKSYSTAGVKTGSISITDASGTTASANCTNSVTVTAPAPPIVTTNAATSITATGATLNSTINPNGTATTSWFRYSSTNPTTCNDTFGTRVPASGGTAIGSGSANVADSRSLTGLTTGTTYYFCAIAESVAGKVYGNVLSFAAQNLPDLIINSIATNPAAVITGSNVTVSAVVKNQGLGSAAASSTRLRIDVGNNGTWDVNPANQSTNTLAANGTETETWSNVWTATAGTHRFEVCADVGAVGGAVTEANENNNCSNAAFTISAGPGGPGGPGGPPPPPGSRPWIQTTGGDVHSNTRINTPGGP